jgi:hypothetical protein
MPKGHIPHPEQMDVPCRGENVTKLHRKLRSQTKKNTTVKFHIIIIIIITINNINDSLFHHFSKIHI